MKQHPMQPLEWDGDVVRFKANAIVRYLLDWCASFNGHVGYAKIDGPAPDLNQLAILPFSQEDREQLAQLLGYSASGFCELDYVSDRAKDRAERRIGEMAVAARKLRAKL